MPGTKRRIATVSGSGRRRRIRSRGRMLPTPIAFEAPLTLRKMMMVVLCEAVVEPNLPTVGVCSSIEKTAQAILDARQKYAGASFAELYGEKMYLFADLVAAHAANDAAVLKAYGWPTDLSEPEIVSRLFDMYAKLTEGKVRK